MPPIQEFEIHAIDLAGLDRLALAICEHCDAPMTFGLVGTLGAGKTRCVQSLVRAWLKRDNVQTEMVEVTSPTFTLLQTYDLLRESPLACIKRIHHLDAYRVADEDEFLELGVEELFDDGTAWTIVEWADRMVQVMPLETVWVHFAIEPEVELRRLRFSCQNESIFTRLGHAHQQWLKGETRAHPQGFGTSPKQ